MHAICTHKAVHSVLVQLVWPAHVRLERAAVPDGGERVARGCRQARKGVAVCNKAQAAAPTAAAQWQLRARGSAAPYVRGGGGTDEGPRWRQSGRTWSGRGTLRLYAAQLVPGCEDQARSCMCAKAAGQTQSARMQKIGRADPARNETRRGHGRDAACDLRGMLGDRGSGAARGAGLTRLGRAGGKRRQKRRATGAREGAVRIAAGRCRPEQEVAGGVPHGPAAASRRSRGGAPRSSNKVMSAPLVEKSFFNWPFGRRFFDF